MKFISIATVVIVLLYFENVNCNESLLFESDEEIFAKLLFLVPANKAASYSINEVNQFTNQINHGWLFDSNKNIKLLLYLLVKERINSIEDIDKGYVYFSTSETDCLINEWQIYHGNPKNISEKVDYIFKLEFDQNRSKFFNNSALKKHRIRNTDRSQLIPNRSTLLVAETTVFLKYNASIYYPCIHFERQNHSKREDTLKFIHQGTRNKWTHIITTRELLPIYLVIVFYSILLCFSALFSGLNLGLMSLDLTELAHLVRIGSAKEKSYAKKIIPLRQKGNLLLCTILIGNVLVNSTSTLILGNYLEGVFAAVGSTLLIVVFGEIIPQAACSRHGLAVGAHTRYITYFMMFLTYVISYPLSKILDLVLGQEIAAVYTRDKVRELIRRAKDDKENGIAEKEFKILSGALDFKNKTVEEIMVKIKDVFSLDINSTLDFDTFKTILYHGYSRIPVYEFTKENLVGMILIQDLLLNDPADKVPLRAVIDYYKHSAQKCRLQDCLKDVFDRFRQGSHMAFVYNNDTDIDNPDQLKEAVGIITIEDLIEELVQSEIMDEADTKREKRRKRAKEFLKGKLANLSLSTENLNIFVTDDQTNRPIISTQIRKALFYFLASSVKPFMGEFISPKILETFLKQPELTIEKRNLVEVDNESDYLYKYDVECDYFIIILDGSATVLVGRNEKEKMEINAGLFSYYGVGALLYENEYEMEPLKCITKDEDRRPYKPEFSLRVNSYCVFLRITRKDWKDAVRKSILERTYTITQTSPTANSPVSTNSNHADISNISIYQLQGNSIN